MAALSAVILAFGGGAAQAEPSRIQFRIEPQSYAEALLDLAQQANITLIGGGACSGFTRNGLRAAMTVEEALGRLLAEAPCSWRLIAPGAVKISPLPQPEASRPDLPVKVEEVLVTATRRIRDPRRLAVAVTAIPRIQLQATSASDAGEAAGQFAGVLATNLGPGRNKLLLRGLSDGVYTGRARSTVATYLDDIPLNYSAPDPDLRLVDVERVEVARGPQGALYGAGSLSGIYRIVTRKPDTERYSGELRVSGAATEHGALGESIEGYVNAPVWRDIVAVRLSGYHEVQGGYLDNPTLQRVNVDRTLRRGARLVILLQPDDKWKVYITAAGQHLRSDDTHYTTPGLGLTRTVRIAEPHVNDIETLTATVRRSWGWAELTSSTGFVRHAYGSLYDSTDTKDLYTSFGNTSSYSERSRTQMLVQDIVLTSRGAGRFDWLAGFYGSDTKVRSPTEFLVQVPRVAGAQVYGDDRRDRIREIAAYGEVSYEFAKNWTLGVGGRVFSIHEHTVSNVNSERLPPRNLDRTSAFRGVSPKISIQRTFGGGDLVYAAISEGHRAGGINSGGAVPLSPDRETFGPDRLRNYELGLKMTDPARRLSLDTAVFYEVWKDIQTDQFRPSGIPYTTNAGDAEILGLETEVALRTDMGLTVQVNGRLSRTQTMDPNPLFTTQLVDGLPGAPAISGGVLTSYERQVFRDWTLRLVGQATYVGRSRVTFDTSIPKMGGYARVKLLAEVSRKHLGAQIYVINPLGSYNDTFAFGNPFNPSQTRQVTPQRPRTIGVTLFANR